MFHFLSVVGQCYQSPFIFAAIIFAMVAAVKYPIVYFDPQAVQSGFMSFSQRNLMLTLAITAPASIYFWIRFFQLW